MIRIKRLRSTFLHAPPGGQPGRYVALRMGPG